MPADVADLCFEFHFGCDLADADVLTQLQSTLGRLAPKMSDTLEVHAYERDRTRRPVDVADPAALRVAVLAKGTERRSTLQALTESHAAPRHGRRFGEVLLRGRGPGSSGIFLSVSFDNLMPARPAGRSWLWSNSVGGRLSVLEVEGMDRQEWVCELADALTTTTTMLWGAAYLHPEFARSNLDTAEGMRAVGRDVRTSLPGIYWVNIFGPPYVDLIGKQRLLDASAHSATVSGNHVTIRTYGDAEQWEANDETRHRLTAALGREHFFDRDDPLRHHRAPDFGLPELPLKPPFQALLAEGGSLAPPP